MHVQIKGLGDTGVRLWNVSILTGTPFWFTKASLAGPSGLDIPGPREREPGVAYLALAAAAAVECVG